MGKVIIEFDEDDLERLFETQTSILEVMLRIETLLKEKAKDDTRSKGAYYFYPVTGGYGKSGVPDIVGCFRGKFFGIECKAGGNKPTPLQEKNLREIADCEGIALVVNEENMNDVLDLIDANPAQLEFDFEDTL